MAAPDALMPRCRPTWFVQLSVALHGLCLIAFIVEPGWWPRLLGILVANHLLISAVGLWPRSNWLGQNWTQLPPACAARRQIALTIDDGPDPVVTPQVLALLDRYQIKASFFCIGSKAKQYPELCREIARRGHMVENHSQHHRHNFSLLGPSAFLREIKAAQETLGAITGRRPQFFRAPAGLRNPFLDTVLTRLGLRLASWSIRGFDTRVSDAGKVRQRLLLGLRPGAILLLHDGNAAQTQADTAAIVAVLPAVIEQAKAHNLHFVTLHEALDAQHATASDIL